MRRTVTVLVVVASAAFPHAARAQGGAAGVVTRTARTEVVLTIYGDDRALVKDTREADVPSGDGTLRFEDVARGIDARTVAVRSLTAPDRLTVVEQSFAFDLRSPEQLLERWVGREVELVETADRLRDRVTPAVLLSAGGGNVYRIGDRIAVGHPGRIVLPDPPADLYVRPTLRWRLANEGPARHRLEVSYLTTGLSWTADYVLVVGDDDTAGDLTCWATITNQSGARWDDAGIRLLAGEVERARRPAKATARTMDLAAQEAAAPRFGEERLLDYHLYTLDRRTTILADETKQLRLLGARGVQLAKAYRVVGQPAWWRSRAGDLERDVPVGVYLEFRNDAASRLGMPLPAGTMRLYKEDASGARQLVGEDTIPHRARDERIVLRAGSAFDVVASRTQTDWRTVSQEPFRVEVGFAVRLRNRRKAPVTVSIREPVGGEWKVVESSHPPVRVDAGTLGFEAPVPAGGEVTVRYRAQVGY
jgi:hypothetical protein